MSETYIEIMIQSLKKKIKVLDQIIELDELQKEQLENPTASADDFDQTVEDKATLIQQLDQLDSGFDKLYSRVREELQGNKEAFTDQIAEMQELIRAITDRSVKIQSQEARNKNLMTQKFAKVKKQVKEVRTNTKVANQYYRNMTRVNYIDPQFMDNKK